MANMYAKTSSIYVVVSKNTSLLRMDRHMTKAWHCVGNNKSIPGSDIQCVHAQ